MSRVHARNARVLVEAGNGTTYEFMASDWSIEYRQDRGMMGCDLTQVGNSVMNFTPAAVHGTFEFTSFGGSTWDSPSTATAEVILDRYLKMIGAKEE